MKRIILNIPFMIISASKFKVKADDKNLVTQRDASVFISKEHPSFENNEHKHNAWQMDCENDSV